MIITLRTRFIRECNFKIRWRMLDILAYTRKCIHGDGRRRERSLQNA